MSSGRSSGGTDNETSDARPGATTAASANQRFDAAILLPKPSLLRGPDLVLSEAARERRTSVSQRFGGTQQFQVWRPSQDPEGIFQKFGLVIEHRANDSRQLPQIGSGVAQRLPNLGGYVVYGPRGELRLDDLRQEFGRDFVVARDYRVYQKSEFDDGDGPAMADDTNWSDISGVKKARELGVDGKNIRFGVVDTGVDADHTEFSRRIVPFSHVPYREDVPASEGRRGFDPSGHGTHITSVIAGRGVGIAGAGRIFVAGVGEGHSTTTHLRRILRGLDWLYGALVTGNNKGQPVVLNFSLGFEEKTPRGEDATEYAAAMQALESAIEATIDSNMLVVASIGNDGEDRYRLPGGLSDVLGIGAVDWEGDQVMRFSGNVPANPSDTARSGPDLVGIGQNVLGADGRNIRGDSLYARWSGTSQASAYVAGIAGLYWSMNRQMPAADVRALLHETAQPAPRGEDQKRWGSGLARFAPPPKLITGWKSS